MISKTCSKCKQEKDEFEFYVNSRNLNGLTSWCKDCYRECRRDYRQNDLWHNHGLIEIEYEMMLKSQDGKCAICQQSETAKNKIGKIKHLSVDHDHKTYKIRGLLCQRCNIRLSSLEDSNWTPKAQKYLEKYK